METLGSFPLGCVGVRLERLERLETCKRAREVGIAAFLSGFECAGGKSLLARNEHVSRWEENFVVLHCYAYQTRPRLASHAKSTGHKAPTSSILPQPDLTVSLYFVTTLSQASAP